MLKKKASELLLESANPFDRACTLVNIIEKRITEIANNECSDYPNIKEQDIFGELWAIEQTIQGVILANKDLHKIIEDLEKKDESIFKSETGEKLLFSFQTFIHINNIHCPAVDDIEKMIMTLLEELNHKTKLHENYDKAMLEDKETISKLKMTINDLRQKLKSRKGEA